MNAVNMTSGSAGAMDKRSGILYPLMLIAAIAVTPGLFRRWRLFRRRGRA